MSMQATIPQFGLKSFTKALACLARYGDDMTLLATSGELVLSATNSSKSAYGRVKFSADFFENYSVMTPKMRKQFATQNPSTASDNEEDEEDDSVRGELLVKSVLSVLRHRTVQETVNKCEILVVDGDPDITISDTRASVFILRLHCKHGVTKTHRLSMNTPTNLLAPRVPPSSAPSNIVVGPRAMKDLLEHFSGMRRNDAQLIWEFDTTEIRIKSLVGGAKEAQIATEIKIDADEFDVYDIRSPPIVMSFHLREFNATTALSEALSLPLNLIFSAPGAPLTVEIQAEEKDCLFVIATGVVSTHLSQTLNNVTANDGKRKRAAEDAGRADRRKSNRVVQVTRIENTHPSTGRRVSNTNANANANTNQAGPSRPVSSNENGAGADRGRIASRSVSRDAEREPSPPVIPPSAARTLRSQNPAASSSSRRNENAIAGPSSSRRPPPSASNRPPSVHSPIPQIDPYADIFDGSLSPPAFESTPISPRRRRAEQPLFLSSQPTQPERPSSPLPPPLSQLSAADADVIRASGLGIENMGAEEFEALMDAEGEEIEYVPRENIKKEDTSADAGENGDVDMVGVGGVEQWDREWDMDAEMESDDIVANIQMPSQMRVAKMNGKPFRPLFD